MALEQLNKEYGKESIIKMLSNHILNGEINLPLRDLSIDDARNSFVDLVNYKCNDYQIGDMFTRYDYSFDNIHNGKIIYESNVGNIASDYFQQYNRFCCGSVNAPSPIRTWNNEKFLHGALSAIWSLKCKEINASTLRTCLSLRKYVASQFKPAIAKSIYEKFNSVDVLDFSAGWGDRLCGFYSCKNTKSYIGIDPNRAVFDNYQKQADLYSSIVGAKETRFICSPAEDVHLDKEIVDTVFTSPPYFNVERYSDDNTQSYKRYKKFDDWLENFLFKTIDMSWYALKPKGYMIINISDVYSGHKINNICDRMNEYIYSIGGNYVECMGMKMSKRPNSKASKNGQFVEPIWVWQKS